MTQLTEERFDQILTEKLAPLATKSDVRNAAEELARITSAGFTRIEERFDDLETRLDVTEQIIEAGSPSLKFGSVLINSCVAEFISARVRRPDAF